MNKYTEGVRWWRCEKALVLELAYPIPNELHEATASSCGGPKKLWATVGLHGFSSVNLEWFVCFRSASSLLPRVGRESGRWPVLRVGSFQRR